MSANHTMKTQYKIIFSLTLMPLFVLAAPVPTASNFCSRLQEISLATLTRIDDRETKIHNRQTKISQNISSGRGTRDGDKVANRMRWDAIRDQHVAILKSKAQNDAQKGAIERYIAAITDAINTHRIAINSAFSSFRQGIDQVRLARIGVINTYTINFKAAVTAALDKARTDCDNGLSQTTVHRDLVAALKIARQQFNTDRSSAEKLSTNIQTLIVARKSAMAEGLANFKIAVQKARADLKKSFPAAD